MKQASVLILDDEVIMRDFLEETLKRKLLNVECTAEPYTALKKLKEKFYEIFITDLKLPYLNGLEVLKKSKEISPYTEVVLITAYGTVESAVEAMKLGAFDYINKPFKPEEIELIVDTIIKRFAEEKEEKEEKEEEKKEETVKFPEIVTNSKQMIDVLKLISRVA
ncbi:MAG: response regulator, partial [Candidatus Hydrogenedentota bacterium]